MDLCTFVKAGYIGSASLLLQGLDPMVRADSAPAAPGLGVADLKEFRDSPADDAERPRPRRATRNAAES